jgi:hypothetical protein
VGFKVEKRKPEGEEAGPKPKRGMGPLQMVFGLFFTLFVAWSIEQLYFPMFDDCDFCGKTGALACGAPDCVNGRVRCTAACLKKDDPGWQHMDVAGHSPNELWMRFDNDDHGWKAWSQGHIGELIEKVDGKWVDKGACPVCQGTGRMPCPVCHSSKKCPRCDGAGVTRHWYLW